MTEDEQRELARFVHDARKPLNRISMQAELVKMALNDDIPREKANDALDKIISATKDCSETLADLVTALSDGQSG
ncbi:hypothetical protein [Alteromonas sp. CYL-A6]|uniref:hypothetical protein n=1 Tax=Alteromonas nitratireducens TaxID=3390813 RepID=UPI0034BB61FD